MILSLENEIKFSGRIWGRSLEDWRRLEKIDKRAENWDVQLAIKLSSALFQFSHRGDETPTGFVSHNKKGWDGFFLKKETVIFLRSITHFIHQNILLIKFFPGPFWDGKHAPNTNWMNDFFKWAWRVKAPWQYLNKLLPHDEKRRIRKRDKWVKLSQKLP